MKRREGRLKVAKRGFTLIELLTVIAIIALLAAIIFPVMSAVRRNARESSCMSNMHTIVQALKMYKDDWRVYPDALFGYEAAAGGGCPTSIDTKLMTGRRLALSDYVSDPQTFVCPESPVKYSETAATVEAMNQTTNAANGFGTMTFCYPAWDSYDFQYRGRTVTPSTPRYAHYLRKWTTLQPGVADDPRQLIYRDPPESSVVTYCLYHSLDSQGQPEKGRQVLVAFLSGRVQKFPSEHFAQFQSVWQAMPKP